MLRKEGTKNNVKIVGKQNSHLNKWAYLFSEGVDKEYIKNKLQ